jgi:hypothetical protein
LAISVNRWNVPPSSNAMVTISFAKPKSTATATAYR